MSVLLPSLNVKYIGADIVSDLIDELNLKFSARNISFEKIDIIQQSFPDADLMICRDCLFHLTFDQIHRVLINFIKSRIPYFLTTTHKNTNNFRNIDIETGDFRMIDLFSHPFNFPKNPLMRIEDWMPPEPQREMCLFNREQILQALSLNKLMSQQTFTL
jgi:hypothetical protein